MRRVIILVIGSLLILACQKESYQVVTNPNKTGSVNAKDIIDITATLEGYGEDNIPEFSGGSWAIAVGNPRTGYIYYYDASNKFLGREKK